MAVSSSSPYAERAPTAAPTEQLAKEMPSAISKEEGAMACDLPAKASINSAQPSSKSIDGNSATEFSGDVNTTNEIPNRETLKKVEDFMLLDRDGRTIQFKDIYSGPNVARRVLVIFIRHFFCGNCQEYLRTLTSSITPDSLLHLPVPTFIAIIGCGSPSLIPMYQAETNCPFPIYADPTKSLYDALGMLRTLNLGSRPEYQRRGTVKGMFQSIRQGFVQLGKGKAFMAGDMYQVGGEFLFEPVDSSTPICSPDEREAEDMFGRANGNRLGVDGEEKRVTWCHRMRNTRDHAEIPELREVLGMDGEGVPGNDKKRWSKALIQRKGTGLGSKTSGIVEDGRKSHSSEKLMGQAEA